MSKSFRHRYCCAYFVPGVLRLLTPPSLSPNRARKEQITPCSDGLFPAELLHKTIRKVAASTISVSFCILTTLSNLLCAESIKVLFWCAAPIFSLPKAVKRSVFAGIHDMHHCCAAVTKWCECDTVQRNNMYVQPASPLSRKMLVLCKRKYA